MDCAALSLGLVPVPMHLIDQPESLAYVLADSGASLLLIDTASHWETLEPLSAQFPALKRVVYLSGNMRSEGAITRSLPRWLGAAEGEPSPETPAGPGEADLAAIVYTSGTTGRPKGVMLSHRNVVSNVQAILQRIPVYDTDVFLSFLPLSHTLERTAGYYLPMAAGASVVFARSVKELPRDLIEVRPTVLISVPRIYERAHVALRDSLAHHRVRSALLESAIRMGWRRFAYIELAADRPTFPERILGAVLDRLVGTRVRRSFGGRLRAAVTGGAPIPPSVAHTFLALGVPLLQGYGLTECSPVVACNRPGENHPESVGAPLPGVEVRIGENDELLVRGASVMLGYWHRPEDTARVLDGEGWLHTGDQARIEDGRLVIQGRIKDIIVTSTGEKIAPADLESAILEDPLFEQALVLGEGRPFIAALVVVNMEAWAREARGLALEPDDAANLNSLAASAFVLGRIRRAVRAFPAYAQPRAVFAMPVPWSVEAGLITPTLKPKRAAIERKFQVEIDELYRGHSARAASLPTDSR
jgi:long-chain acyl-CoA synthetase